GSWQFQSPRTSMAAVTVRTANRPAAHVAGVWAMSHPVGPIPAGRTRQRRFCASKRKGRGAVAMLIALLAAAPAPAESPAARAPARADPPAARGGAPPPGPQRIERPPPVVVIGSTPVPALGTPIDKYPGNVQTMSAKEIDSQNLVDITDTLYRRFGSVNINGNQGNPWQNDLTYRGFLASPLAGHPLGLSMYLDRLAFTT